MNSFVNISHIASSFQDAQNQAKPAYWVREYNKLKIQAFPRQDIKKILGKPLGNFKTYLIITVPIKKLQVFFR